MREEMFRTYMEEAEEIESKKKAINSRISRAYKAEEILGMSLDMVVEDDDKMNRALVCIKKNPSERNGNIQNAVRWYYRFVNKKEFPAINTYVRTKGKHI